MSTDFHRVRQPAKGMKPAAAFEFMKIIGPVGTGGYPETSHWNQFDNFEIVLFKSKSPEKNGKGGEKTLFATL